MHTGGYPETARLFPTYKLAGDPSETTHASQPVPRHYPMQAGKLEGLQAWGGAGLQVSHAVAIRRVEV